jgi:catechol 2,3-dioxygenase-like lactoylglutathione lyase family enzyme
MKDCSNGIPLGFAAIGVRSMDESIAFYRDVIGFDVLARGLAGPEFIELLGLPPATAIEVCRMSACGFGIGQLLLFAPDLQGREPARRKGDRTTRGLWNINFYVDDIVAVSKALWDQYEFWSEPRRYLVNDESGEAIEVLFEAPDGVAINLVQPLGDETTFIGRVRIAADEFGRTRHGFTPIVTTSHCVTSMSTAQRFYEAMLGVNVVMDAQLGKPETNWFLARSPGSLGHTVFLAGNHFFGKLSLTEPLNFQVPERAAAARPDAIGYLAQGFFVPDIQHAVGAALAAGGQTVNEGNMVLPGFDGETAVLLRVPGSGALAWLVETTT